MQWVLAKSFTYIDHFITYTKHLRKLGIKDGHIQPLPCMATLMKMKAKVIFSSSQNETMNSILALRVCMIVHMSHMILASLPIVILNGEQF